MKKFWVTVDYGGVLEYEIEANSPSEALDYAEQFALEYIPKYTVETLDD